MRVGKQHKFRAEARVSRPLDVHRRPGETEAAFAHRLIRSTEARIRQRLSRGANVLAELSHSDDAQDAPQQALSRPSDSNRATPKRGEKQPKTGKLKPIRSAGFECDNGRDNPRGHGGGGVSPPLRGGETPTDSPRLGGHNPAAVEPESESDDAEPLVAALVAGVVEQLSERLERRLATMVELAVKQAFTRPSSSLPLGTLPTADEGSYGPPPTAAAVPSAGPVAASAGEVDQARVVAPECDNPLATHDRATAECDNPSGADPERKLLLALRAGFLLTLWDACVLSAEAAARPWTEDDVLALLEAYRAAQNVALPEDAFGVVMRWFDLYAHDTQVRARDKAPRHFGAHFAEYLAAAVPPRGQYVPDRVLARWAALSGDTTSTLELRA